jgi:hypothetical protein
MTNALRKKRVEFREGGSIGNIENIEVSRLASSILVNAVEKRFITIDQYNDNDVRSVAEEVAEDHRNDDEIGSSDWTYIMKEFYDGIGYKTSFENNRLVVENPNEKFSAGGAVGSVFSLTPYKDISVKGMIEPLYQNSIKVEGSLSDAADAAKKLLHSSDIYVQVDVTKLGKTALKSKKVLVVTSEGVRKLEDGGFVASKKYPNQYTVGEDDGEKPLFTEEEVELIKDGYKIENEYRASRRSRADIDSYVAEMSGDIQVTFSDNEFGGNWRIWKQAGKFESGGTVGFDQYGNPYGFEREGESVYEWHYKPEMDAEKPYLVWDKIEGEYVTHLRSRQLAIEWIENNGSYSKGGNVKHATFQQKVDAVSENLEGKSVPKKYRKLYGETYSEDEANLAARKIAGSMRKKYEYHYGGAVDNISKGLIISSFKKHGLSADKKENKLNDIEFDDRNNEIIVEFTSLKYAGELPKNIDEILKDIASDLIADDWVWRNDNPYKVTFIFEDKEKYADGGMVNAREFNKKVKNWYIKNYPADDLGEEIKDTITFKSLWALMSQGYDVYEVLGVSDSVIRERVFEKLSEILGVDYNVVYKKWLQSGKYADGGITGTSNESIRNAAERMANNERYTTEDLKQTYERYCSDLKDFRDGLIPPRKIIGTGYKPQYARKIATEWLEDHISEYKQALAIRGVAVEEQEVYIPPVKIQQEEWVVYDADTYKKLQVCKGRAAAKAASNRFFANGDYDGIGTMIKSEFDKI